MRDRNSKLNEAFVDPNYDERDAAAKAVYENVFAPYCRTCHVAQQTSLSRSDDPLWPLATSAVFEKFYMPNAEQTNHNFWSSPAPAELARFLATKPGEPNFCGEPP